MHLEEDIRSCHFHIQHVFHSHFELYDFASRESHLLQYPSDVIREDNKKEKCSLTVQYMMTFVEYRFDTKVKGHWSFRRRKKWEIPVFISLFCFLWSLSLFHFQVNFFK